MFPILPCKTILISSSFNHCIFIHILISVLFQNCISLYHIYCQFATNLQNNNYRFLCSSYIFKLLVCHFFADSSIHAILFCSLLLRLHSFDFSLCTFFAHIGQYFEIAEPGTYSTPHTVQCLAGNAVHRFVGVICNSPTKPMNL